MNDEADLNLLSSPPETLGDLQPGDRFFGRHGITEYVVTDQRDDLSTTLVNLTDGSLFSWLNNEPMTEYCGTLRATVAMIAD